MRFLIRDDDTCAYTRPEELERCYRRIWDRAPVGLAVTPFRIPGDAPCVPEPHRGSATPLPLAGNAELTAFLRELVAARRAEILLHGYHHTKPRGLPEYVGETDLLRKTREGKRYLEDLLGCRIGTFVPPNNGIGREGLAAVAACGLNLVNVPPLLRPGRRPCRPENLAHWAAQRYFRSVKRMRYPYVMRFRDHQEVDYHAITPSQSLEELLTELVKCQRDDGVYVAAVHYHAFGAKLGGGQTVGQALAILLDKALAVPANRFPTFAEIWSS